MYNSPLLFLFLELFSITLQEHVILFRGKFLKVIILLEILYMYIYILNFKFYYKHLL